MPPETYNALNDADPRLAAVLRGEVWPTGFSREWSAPTTFAFSDWRMLHTFGAKLLHGTNGETISVRTWVDGWGKLLSENDIATNRKYRNVCRPFDEAQLESGELWEWKRIVAPTCDLFPLGFARCREFNGGGNSPLHTCRDIAEFVAPPNHGHGSPCTCLKLVATPRKAEWDDTHGMVVHLQGEALCVTAATKAEALSVAKQGAMKLRPGSHMLPVPDGLTLFVITRRPKRSCQWCEGTGSVVCDQDGRGGRSRVSKKMRVAWTKWARANLGDDASADPLGYATPMLADSTVGLTPEN